MTLQQLNKRERMLAAAIVTVLVLGGYGLFRYKPADAGIDNLTRQFEATKLRISKLEIPEESDEVIEDVLEKLDDQEEAMAFLSERASLVESRLATKDSQQLKVLISALATQSGIRIKSNEQFKATPVSQLVQTSRNNRKAAVSVSRDVIVPASAGWISRMSPGSMYERPLQQLQIEGDYEALRRFLHGLEDLPWQVAVLRMNIKKLPITPLRGMPQPLAIDVVLAL